MSNRIAHWVRITNNTALHDGNAIPAVAATPEDVYRQLQYNYIRFFKMDVLCKWAWLGAETILKNDGSYVFDNLDKTKVGLVLFTGNGCLEVDKKYNETIAEIASPALFVYTLPNIMLGEICIKYGFKGEQASLVSPSFNATELHFWVNDLLANRSMDACLCGWVDATETGHDVCLFWVAKGNGGLNFSPAVLQQAYDAVYFK